MCAARTTLACTSRCLTLQVVRTSASVTLTLPRVRCVPDERLRAETFFGAPRRVERRGKAHGVNSLLQTAKSLHNSLSNPAPPLILYCHFLHIPGPHLQRLFYMYLHFRSPSNITTPLHTRQCIATDVLSSLNGVKTKKTSFGVQVRFLGQLATCTVSGRLGVRVSPWFRGVMRCICVTWASGTSWRGRALSKPLAPGKWTGRSAAQIFQPTLFRHGAWITAPHSRCLCSFSCRHGPGGVLFDRTQQFVARGRIGNSIHAADTLSGDKQALVHSTERTQPCQSRHPTTTQQSTTVGGRRLTLCSGFVVHVFDWPPKQQEVRGRQWTETRERQRERRTGEEKG